MTSFLIEEGSFLKKIVAFIVILIVLFAVNGYILYRLYSTSGLLVEARKDTFVSEFEGRSKAMDDYLNQRMKDLEALIINPAVSNYYLNKALGMSLEYGLAVSLDNIKDAFNRVQQITADDGGQAFSGIAYFDLSENRIIAKSDSVGEFSNLEAKVRAWGTSDTAGIVSTKTQDPKDERSLFVFGPFRYRGDVRGYLLMELDKVPLRKILGLSTDTNLNDFSALIDEEGQILVGPAAIQEINLKNFLGISDSLPEYRVFDHLKTLGASGDGLMGALMRLSQNNLYVLTAAPRSRYFAGHSYSLWVLIFLSLMASVTLMVALIYKGSVEIFRMNRSLERKVDELHESEERTRLLLESSVEGFIGVNLQEEITFVNRAACAMLGYSTDELVGQRLDSVIHRCLPEDSTHIPENDQIYDSISRGITFNVDNVILWRKDGTNFPADLSSNSIHKEGRIVGCVITFNDITERKLLEADRMEMARKLSHAQKIESLNAMAKGIAHDFNNLLMAIMGNLELALTDRGLGAVGKNAIENAIQATDRSAELSHQMLIYSGKSFYVPRDLDLSELTNKLAHEEKETLQSVAPQTANLHFEIDKNLPLIRGDENQLQRVITNLAINGAESLGDKAGDVTIRTGQMYCDEAYLSQSRLQEKPSPGLFVFVEVTDTGCGMDAETLRRLFDPFFTTKFWGRGLGMAEVNGTVKSHHGAIIVDSEPEKGTTIRVLFPASKMSQAKHVPAIAAMKTRTPLPDKVSGRQTILVVEDEESVRSMLVSRLDHLGYDTMAAKDGEEGVNVFRANSNEIDVVLLDFVMPGMNGNETFEELTRINPDVKVILSSGYTEDVVWKSFVGKRPSGFLNKPYKTEAVKDELDRLLGPRVDAR